MVQFNLLPNVKMEYVKVRRTKYLMTFISVVVSLAAVAIFLFALLMVDVVQKKSISDLNKDIKTNSARLRSIKDLDKILTVQNQLSTLTSLHVQKPVASRLFGYITQVTPAPASVNKLSVDLVANTMTIGGKAPTLDVVSLYTDTLKGTKYTMDNGATKKNAFSNVVLSSFGRDNQGANFTITFGYDPAIFQVANTVQLVVPSTPTTNETNLFGTGQ